MLAEYQWWHGALLFLVVILEIVANIFLKLSNGFKRLWIGILSLITVLGVFSALAIAVKGIELSIAYALCVRLLVWWPLLLPAGYYLIND